MTGNSFSISGIINQPGDRDAFKVTIPSNSEFLLNAIPNNVGTGDNGANVDIKISLLDNVADTLGHYNPANLLDAGVDTILKSGHLLPRDRWCGKYQSLQLRKPGFIWTDGFAADAAGRKEIFINGHE